VIGSAPRRSFHPGGRVGACRPQICECDMWAVMFSWFPLSGFAGSCPSFVVVAHFRVGSVFVLFSLVHALGW